ncbi:MAG: hypothetical protein ACLQGV_15140 [Bryobacteraceae bacterium]
MTDAINQYTSKPARYGHLDGTDDLVLGVMFLTWVPIIRLSQAATVLWHWLAMTYGLFAVVGLVAWLGTRYIRRRLVYPRSGYAEFRIRPWALALIVVAAVAVAAAVAWFVFKAPSSRLSYPLILGLACGLPMLIGALRKGVPRLAVLGVFSMAIGFALQLLEPTAVPGTIWYCLTMGTALILSGAIALCLFVRRMPTRNLEAE